MNRVLIVGATSAIAEAAARLFAARGDRLCLAARNSQRLQILADDLRIRGAVQVEIFRLDANEFDRHEELLVYATKSLGGLDTVLIAHGTLPNQTACQTSVDLALREFTTNALSVISLLTVLANRFEAQGHGTIAVLSSVAGDRGRQSNYVYGAAKGAVTLFTQGLRNRLARHGVHVLTIKPGFVDTPMTASFKKGLLWVGPETVAKGVIAAIDRRANVVYLPFFWRWIMVLIRAIPERYFKKLSL